MRITTRLAAVGATALLASIMWAVPANAAPSSIWVEACRDLDEQGELEAEGFTFGECVNILRGPFNETAKSVAAGNCGLDWVLEETGTTNKGQCIQVLRAIYFP